MEQLLNEMNCHAMPFRVGKRKTKEKKTQKSVMNDDGGIFVLFNFREDDSET